ncbi:hypothetical protein, partial [Mycobacterium riyadhense]|uniref:hypothetical protein n=1 Tax=Mycobacterium riyadhense TaxID=486698 RepID=UPI0021F383FD
MGNHGNFNQGFFNTGNHNLGAFLTGDNLIGIGPFHVNNGALATLLPGAGELPNFGYGNVGQGNIGFFNTGTLNVGISNISPNFTPTDP